MKHTTSTAAKGTEESHGSAVAAAVPVLADDSLPLVERVARAIAGASPMADPSAAAARDAAARALGDLRPLAEASEFHIYWGPFDPAAGYDLTESRLTQLQPLVAAKLYLSLFMFTGEYRVSHEEKTTIVELTAKFRDKLPLGDYPHPLWNTPEEWGSYTGASSVLLVFSGEHLGAIMLKPDSARTLTRAPSWDGKWRWRDAAGVEQPRVSKFDYLFSPENPGIKPLQEAYADLELSLVENKCVSCHAPDNRARMMQLTLLTYPNQSLAARHSIPAVLRAESMPPGDSRRGVEPGIHDAKTLQDMIRKADEFDRVANEAIAFEKQRLASPTPVLKK